MRKFVRTATLSMACTALLAGCLATPELENPVGFITNSQYVVSMTKADVQPTPEELGNARAKVIVLPVKINTEQKFESGAMREIAGKLENGLNLVGVDSIDRSLGAKLADEIVAYETTGKYQGSGIKLAGFAVLASINNVQLGANFTPANPGLGTQAMCSYTGDLTGHIKVYKLPDLSIVDQVNLEGTSSQQTVMSYRDCPINALTASSLVSKAAENSIFGAMPMIQKHFVQTGYVVAYRKRETDHIVQVSMGSDHGVKKGQKIQFVRKLKTVHPQTKQTRYNEVPFDFVGTVTQLVDSDLAWVKVDALAEGQLQYGDVARQLFAEKSQFEQLLQNLTN